MKRLPVPPLRQSLDGYLQAVAPLVDSDALAAARRSVESFAHGDGPACQEALERFADAEHVAGRNWMSEVWYAGYWATRAPLTLSTNAALQVHWDSPLTGVTRAADVVQRFAAAHLTYLRGEAAPEMNDRGDALDPRQLRFIAGGVREPRPGQDVFLPGPVDPSRRQVVVLDRGRAAALTVSDDAGEVVEAIAVEAALREFLEAAPVPRVSFTGPGYTDTEAAAALLADLMADPGNAAAYGVLRDALFVVNLTDEPVDVETYLERSAFALDRGWPFKGVSLQVDLSGSGFVVVHMEHSMFDGGALQTLVGWAQQMPTACDVRTGPVAGSAGGAPSPLLTPLAWSLTDRQETLIGVELERYVAATPPYRFRIVIVPTGPEPPLPFRLSRDAAIQLVMLYAQVKTYGRVRSTYEAVDMREYQAGRTECLRANTPAAVALAFAMVRGDATVDQLAASFEAHRRQVKACKSGQGIDRHLFGLRMIAESEGYAVPFAEDAAYQALTTDFLSTSALGDPTRILRSAFAPTSHGGIGVYYTALDHAFEFFLNYDEGVCERPDAFAQALHEATEALWSLLVTTSTVATPPS